ncbi:MAG: polysaccharide biosynthesis C-terminal domain-containing protein [bacterium]
MIGETLRKVGRQAAVYSFGDLLVKSMSFLLIPILTRAWPADSPQMGMYDLLHLAEAVAYLFFNMGLAVAVMKVMNDYRHGRARGSVVFTTLGLLSTLSLGLFAGAWFAAPTIAPVLFGTEVPAVETAWYLRLTLLATYLSTFRFVTLSVLRVEERPWLYTFLNILNFMTYVGLGVYLVVWEQMGVLGIVYANLTASVLMLAVCSMLLQSRARRPFSAARARSLLEYGLPLLPNGLALWALALLDRWLLRELGGDLSVVGQYGVAYKFGMIVSFLLVIPLRTAWLPTLYTVRDHPDSDRLYGRLLTYVVAIGGAIALGLAVFASEIIAVAADPGYIASAGPLPWIAFAYLAYGVSQVADAGILARNRTRVYPLITATSVAVNVALCVILIPGHGMMGAAWATLAGYVWHALLVGRVSHRYAPIRVEWRRIGLALASAGLVWYLSTLVPDWPMAGRITAKLAVLSLYPVLLWRLGFLSEGERSILGRLRDRTGGGGEHPGDAEEEEGPA